ncbi:MAG TPA: hypothetical protein VG432_15080 [Gemmatimonadaceae bacterium]|nr:hypothetical protein [Gemmatimonadaceae bacterium]
MRSILAPVGLIVLAGCSSLQRPSPVPRAAVSAAACDSVASIAAERAQLASVARMLGDVSTGAGANAYSTLEPRITAPAPSVAGSSASAARATSSMIANANNARVELWSGESRQDRSHYQVVVAQIAALDATARTLPTAKGCRAAGLATAAAPSN